MLESLYLAKFQKCIERRLDSVDRPSVLMMKTLGGSLQPTASPDYLSTVVAISMPNTSA